MKKIIKTIHHQLNNELAKLIPSLEFMAEDPSADHAKQITRLAGLLPKIIEQSARLSEELGQIETQGLFHLAYISKWVPSKNGIEQDIEKIMTKARPFNHDYNVTGLLVFQADHFIQYLEGDLEDLYTVYGRISLDPRHEALRLLSLGPVAERNFHGWDMDYYIVTALEEERLRPLRDTLSQLKEGVSAQEVLSFMSLIKGFKLKK